MRQGLLSGAPNSTIPICSLIQFTVCVVGLGTSPLSLTEMPILGRPSLPLWARRAVIVYYLSLAYLGSWAFLAGSYLTLSMKPSSWHSACWCCVASGSHSCLCPTAPKGRSWWLWRSFSSWLPGRGYKDAPLPQIL